MFANTATVQPLVTGAVTVDYCPSDLEIGRGDAERGVWL